MTRVLKLDQDDPAREFKFDLDYLLSLTSAERYEMMLRRSSDAVERMIHHGHLQPVEVVKRAARPVRRHRRDRVPRTRVHPRDRGRRCI